LSISSHKAIPLAAFVADIDRRRQVTGVTDLPRNAGDRRTASKAAMLAALVRLGADW
jgi:hypothetical protein